VEVAATICVMTTKALREAPTITKRRPQRSTDTHSPAVPRRSAVSLSGSRKRVNGSSSDASSLRMASYVCWRLAIGTFFKYSSLTLRCDAGCGCGCRVVGYGSVVGSAAVVTSTFTLSLQLF